MAVGAVTVPRRGRVWQTILAAGLAGLCAAVLATRVHTGLHRVRHRVVTAPVLASTASVSVPLPDLRALAGQPAALVARFGGASGPAALHVSLNGTEILRAAVPPSGEVRVDAPILKVPDGPGDMVVSGDRTGWTLRYLEIANVYGFSEGVAPVLIVPRERTAWPRLPVWAVGAIFAVLFALRPRPAWPRDRRARVLHQAGSAVVVLLFVGVLAADRVTKYQVLFSVRTFVLCAGVLYLSRLVQASAWAIARLRRAVPAMSHLVRRGVAGVSRATGWPRLPAAIAVVMAVGLGTFAHVRGTHIAGGSDSYGYVSQAELLAQGRLYDSVPILHELPRGLEDWVATPLGYVPHRASGVRGRIVPQYAPGLPLLMAALRRPFGFDAVFLVVPILTAATVWLTYVLGRQVHGAAAGCVAACWLATTPAFTMAAVTPMSDVPAAAFWTAALAACGGSGRWRGALAGGAAAMAILVRPNLAPLAAMIALPFAVRAWRQHTRPALAGLLACLAAAGSGVVFVGLLFNFWYGSPFASGYGSFDYLFSLANIGPNLRRYPVWLMSTATALSAAAVLAPVMLTRARMPGARRAWWLLGFCGLVWCAYLPYIPFESWDFLRFLLPAYPAQFVLASTVLVDLTRRTLAPRAFTMVLTALLVLYGANYHNGLLHNDLRTLEARYRRVGEFVRRELPLRAVLLGMQHSGSLRLYGGRETLRSDYLPPLRLEAAIRHLDTRGWRVYFVLDDWEEEGFRDRFGPHSPLGRLDWTPLAIVPGPMPVRIYDPKDRARGSVGEAHAESPKPGAESPTEPSRR